MINVDAERPALAGWESERTARPTLPARAALTTQPPAGGASDGRARPRPPARRGTGRLGTGLRARA
jgi:hypothetical protein